MTDKKTLSIENLKEAILENNNKIKDYVSQKTDKINQINIAQKTVNTELDYGIFEIGNTITNATTPIVFSSVVSGNMELNENGYIKLKKGKTYFLHINLYNVIYTSGIFFVSMPSGEIIDILTSAHASFIYNAKEDIEVTFRTESEMTLETNFSSVNVHEINRKITIDPVEYINTTHGIEDVPIGHIIAHMGTTAPKHYLICDGTEYGIADYPYLAQHIQDNFGLVNYFGGDGVDTFCVPNSIKLWTPAMTSNNSNGYIASCGTQYSSDYSAFKAFNGTASTNTDAWHPPQNATEDSRWFQIDFQDNKTVYGFSFYCRKEFATDSAKNIRIEGSNDGVIFNFIEEIVLDDYEENVGQVRMLSIPCTYRIYKFFTLNSVGDVQFFVNINDTNGIQCIKYEPTYYMQVQRDNTNYLSPSLYSEEERVVGCWIDGKPLYEKTINIGSIDFIGSGTTITNNTFKEIDTITKCIGIRLYSISKSSSAHVSVGTIHEKDSDNISCFTPGNFLSLNYIVIQYTKITDTENSFTNDMIKDYIVYSGENNNDGPNYGTGSNCNCPIYTDEEVDIAIDEVLSDEIEEEIIEE